MNESLDSTEDSFYSIIISPSTLSHLVLLLVNTVLIYTLMSYEISYFGINGSALFLSLAIVYLFTAIIIPWRYSEFLFKINDKGEGVFTRKYLNQALISIIPILVITSSLFLIITEIFERKNINYFMSSLFIILSIGQGLSLVFGSKIFVEKSKTRKESKNSKYDILIRIFVLIGIFTPLIWWFGYGAENVSESTIMVHMLWFLFLLIIFTIGYLIDKYTSNIREKLGNRGKIGDLLMMILIFASSWHILSARRRSPWLVDSVDGLMFVEEGFLMILTIILAVTSMIKRGGKDGINVFGGQSAIFWGISFGYLYAGSISSLTVLSEQLTESSLLQTTAIGHLITAIVILTILPFAIMKIQHDEEEE